jgi:hypothetical protein
MALNKAADADTVYWSLAGCTRVPRPGMSGGTVAGRGEPANRCWGARGYADLTTIFGSCRGANQQIVGAAAAAPSDLAYHADVKRSVEQ